MHSASANTKFLTLFFSKHQDLSLTACRCDEMATCSSQPLIPGNDLLLCVFAPDNAEFGTLESLELVQEEFKEDIPVTSNSTGVLRACTGQVCMLLTPVSLDFFDDDRTETLTAAGTASVVVNTDVGRKLRGRRVQETLNLSFSVDIALDQDFAGLQGGRTGDDEDEVNFAAWLVPLLVFLMGAASCIYYLMYFASP